jgi:hypothetical protein
MIQKENLLFLAVPLHKNKAPGKDIENLSTTCMFSA